jgi:hypothetical protein
MSATMSAVAEAAPIDIDSAVATMSVVTATSKMATMTATMTAAVTTVTAAVTTVTAAVTTVTHKRHHSGSGIAFQDGQRSCLCRRRYQTCGE